MALPACLICGAPVLHSKRWNTWNRFCSRSCAGKNVANYLKATVTSVQRAKWGREGAKTRAVRIHEDVIERYEQFGRQGYWLAYCAGRHALKKARQAEQAKQRKAAA